MKRFLCPVSRFNGGRFPVLTFSFLVNVMFRYLFYKNQWRKPKIPTTQKKTRMVEPTQKGRQLAQSKRRKGKTRNHRVS